MRGLAEMTAERARCPLQLMPCPQQDRAGWGTLAPTLRDASWRNQGPRLPQSTSPRPTPRFQHPQVTQLQLPTLETTPPNPDSFAPAAGLTSPPG